MKHRPRTRPKRPARPKAHVEHTELRSLLAEAQSTLRAIRSGEVDAVVVDSPLGPRIFTLETAEFDYRILVESMNEGALVLTRGALILFANARFAAMVERPLAQLMGCSLFELLSNADRATLRRLFARPGGLDAKAEVLFQRPYGEPLPVSVSIRRLPGGKAGEQSIGIVVSDLSETRKREELLRHFSHSLMQMQENERRQIATDLGDNITQLLCTILARCQLLAERLPAHESRFRAEVVEFATLLRTTTTEVHRISTELRPHGLELLGLVSAIRGVAAEFSERMGVPIEVRCSMPTAHMTSAVELALYRVLQEALRNVEKHARAHRVRVGLRVRRSAIELTIKDDGVGFDAAGLQSRGLQVGGFGLLSMHERATSVGGLLALKSASSAGTEVSFRIPLPPSDAPSLTTS